MLKSLKIKSRLLVSFLIVILLTIFLVIMGVGALNDTNQNFINYDQHAVASALAIKDCRIAVLQVSADVQTLLVSTDETIRQKLSAELDQEEEDYYTSLSVVKQQFDGDQTALLAYEQAADSWFQFIDEIYADITAFGNANGAKHVEQLDVFEDKMAAAATVVTDQINDHKAEEAAANEAFTNMTIIILIGIFVVQIILIVIISSSLTKSIVGPISELDLVAKEMAKGNLKQEIQYHSKDAVGQLADSLRSMITTLSAYVTDIDRAMGLMADGNFDIKPSQPFIGDFKNIEDSITKFIVNMSRNINSIQRASVIVDSAADQVSSSSQNLARGATEQASSIEELTASIVEISGSVDENAASASAANDQSLVVMQEFTASDARMQNLVKAMDEINQSSGEINKIIKTIDDIAFQTNILALNAAVEAARAGSAGKGFAVVADEVRNLASKSADAAKNTTSLIESSIKAVENGSKIAQETAQSLGGVLEGAKKIAMLVQKISVTTKNQSDSSKQIVQNVDNISEVVQYNAATAEESAAASEELSSQAQMLKSITTKFKLAGFAIESEDKIQQASAVPASAGKTQQSKY